MKVGIVIVNFNKKDLLRGCLSSLQSVTYDNFQTILVDNGSTDGSQDLVRNNFPNVRVLEMGYNSGFCKGNNIGIDYCLRSECDAVLLLNNDTEVDSGFLTAMVEAFDSEKIGMIAPKIQFLKRKDIIDSAGLVITPDGLAKNRGLGEKKDKFSSKEEVFCPAGAAALYRRELLEDIVFDNQYLDESFGYYFEELDLGWRARLRGWECVYAPNALVYHLKSASAGSYSEFVAFYTNRNIFYNILKNYPTPYAIRAVFLSILRYPLLAIGILFKKGAGEKIVSNIGICKTVNIIFRGFLDLGKNFLSLVKKRRSIKHSRKAEKKEIKRWFEELGMTFLESLYK